MLNERGIALVITLLVVALLTITVIEFTYSVEVDQHMARNALNGLQASLLARSGINLGEAFLLHDEHPEFDAYAEEWGQVDELNSQLVVPENMRLKVQIIDEGGKLNLNMTRPTSVNQWRISRNSQNQTAPSQVFQSWKLAFGSLAEARGVDPQVADAVADYWDRLFEANFPGQGAPPAGPSPAVGTTSAPTPLGTVGSQILNPLLWDLPSLDDASVIAGLSPSVIRRLRPVVAMLSYRQAQVNANTASREVLRAIVRSDEIVENIVSQRQEEGLRQEDLRQLLSGVDRSDPVARNVNNMLGVRSSYFLIRASAVVNPNPVTGRGGISRSASMLVQRIQRPGVGANTPQGTPRWTLTQLDWQKEGGAALFSQKADQEPGTEDALTSEMGG
jgi:type II secretory pathway component PulK